jgi:hypothetical protein
MNNKRIRVVALVTVGTLALVTLLLAATGVWAGPLVPADVVSSTLSYQGQLLDAEGEPVDGTYEMTFRLYDVATDGTPLWTQVQNVEVEDGLFTAYLDVDAALFDGQALWLGVQVAGDTEMLPRQPLLPAPYAFHALEAPWSGLTGVPVGLDDGDDDTTYSNGTGLGLASNQFSINPTYRLPQTCASGQIAEWNGSSWQCGDDDTGTGSDGWSITGNSGTNPATDFLGTTDDVPLTLAVNAASALRLEPNATSPNLIGGYGGNGVGSGVVGAVIGGGGDSTYPNQVTGDYGTIGGGGGNEVSAMDGTIGGGFWNVTSGEEATVGGGAANVASGYAATIGGGGGFYGVTPLPNTASGDWSTIGGGAYNVTSGADATVGGGYDNEASYESATVGGGWSNTASGDYATVGGGQDNVATATHATVAGGAYNTASGNLAVVGGGGANTVSGELAVVGGGGANTASGDVAVVGGGLFNHADALMATIGGGEHISVTGHAATVAGGSHITVTGDYAAVGGGAGNVASGYAATVGGGGGYAGSIPVPNIASGDWSTIAGGYGNEANYDYATVGGGTGNTASSSAATVAGGYANEANHNYATVVGGFNNIASGSAATVAGGAWNTAGGTYSFAAGQRAKANNPGCFVWGDAMAADVACNNDHRTIFRSSGGFYIYTNWNLTSGMYLSSGGSSWNAVSDQARKENFAPVDTQALLAQLAEMPISTWNYKSQDPAIRHIGPMAQDFNALLDDLGGEGEKYINTLDADGVALAAIQGLYAQNQELTAENTALQAEVDDLETRVAALEAAVGSPQASGIQVSGIWLALGGLAVVAAVVGRRRLGGGR